MDSNFQYASTERWHRVTDLLLPPTVKWRSAGRPPPRWRDRVPRRSGDPRYAGAVNLVLALLCGPGVEPLALRRHECELFDRIKGPNVGSDFASRPMWDRQQTSNISPFMHRDFDTPPGFSNPSSLWRRTGRRRKTDSDTRSHSKLAALENFDRDSSHPQSLSRRRVLPFSSFSVSSGPSGKVFSHSVPGGFSANG